jgi:hypothetical protein
MRCFLALLLLVTSFGLVSCKSDDDPKPYTGGEISAVSFEILGPDSIRINWAESFTDEDGFYVDRQRWPNTWQRKVLHLGPNETSVVDDSLRLGEVYYYKVYAVKGDRESEEEEVQLNFLVPHPINVGNDFNWNQPNRIRLFWTNNAAWADSIWISKQEGDQEWDVPYAVVPGDATEFNDMDMNIEVANTWSFVTFSRGNMSTAYFYTLMPPKKGE